MITDKFIHIHVPKTGGQFVRGLINEKSSHWKLYIEHSHLTLEESAQMLKNNGYGRVPSFTFVRNPWEWYVSRFFFRQKMIESGAEKQYIVLERTGNSIDGFRKYMDMIKRSVYDGKQYKVTQSGGQVWGRTYSHLTISDWHNDLVGTGVDHVGKLENFAEDLGRILRTVAPGIFNRDEVLRRVNAGKTNSSKHPYYKDCYTSELAEMVNSIDKKYIEEFGYNY
jgi:hypothetical protein